MLTENQINGYQNNVIIPEFNQLFNQSCLAVCLDFIIFNQNQMIQNRWNNNRQNYGQLQNLNEVPAPDRNEIANFLAQDFEEAPQGFIHLQVPDLNNQQERENFANQVNERLNNSDIIITGIVGHARIYFRNANRLFTPGMADGEGSHLMEFNEIIDYHINENNQFVWGGETTPMILACNFLQ